MNNTEKKVHSLSRIQTCKTRMSTAFLLATALLVGFSVTTFANEHSSTDSAKTTATTEATPTTSSYLSQAHTSSQSDDALAGYLAHESVFPSFLKITLALVAVIIGIYVTLALLKKAMGRKVSGGSRGNALEVIETCYLAPKRSVTLVRVGKRAALLSVADNTISTLLELNADETEEIVVTAESHSATPDFRHSLQRAKQKITDLGSFASRNRQDTQAERISMKSAK